MQKNQMLSVVTTMLRVTINVGKLGMPTTMTHLRIS